ncbi:glycosyltransferase [Shivajiella indica]|uniref:Glycosyltransferase n=1 Tax=Shivajiella indica TaxID=872115 RepID=A0ABW5BCR7_9BACT
MGFEWYHYAGLLSKNPSTQILKKPKKNYSVDMLTTFCPGEPYDMLENTLRAMVAVEYPHSTYLCDEGDDPYVKRICKELGVIHVTRKTHENAKAGNINNALKQAKGEICVIMDPDHAPFPDFLDHVLHHFDDPEIGYVQVVQAYGNQGESLVAKGAAEQTYTFYGPYMRAMSEFGTAQAIGANCTFRRAALDSIGGHAPGLTEDMHTSMLLHAKGWKSVYESVILSRGLVPSGLAAYYKQQLKWSRGTFDLWVNLYPKLFLKFNWRQKIHYGLMPVYYLFGLIGLIDILVPIYSLLTGEYPWLLNPMVFFTFFTPFFLFSLIFRFYAQGWLNEPEERGLHLIGGILRVGTWWIFILGFIYTIFNVKVPYIPTPKEHSTKGDFLLGLPNLMVALISAAAVIYGLYWDWQPYSLLMALFASVNAIIFFLAFVIGQSSWFTSLRNISSKIQNFKPIRSKAFSFQRLSYLAFIFTLLILFFASSFFVMNSFKLGSDQHVNPKVKDPLDKELGGFYSGIYYPQFDNQSEISLIADLEGKSNYKWAIISTYLPWSDDSLPYEHWEKIIHHGAIPMITWEPWTNLFASYRENEDLKNNKRVFHYILEGYFDEYIDNMAASLRDLNHPVFLRFAHEMENPMYPWSGTGGNTPEEFIEAWIYVHTRFENSGTQNVSWVWSPWSTEGFENYFPHGGYKPYVDWIGLTALNYGLAFNDKAPKTFEEIYLPFKEQIEEKNLKLPIMLAEFGSTSYGTDAKQWVFESIKKIKKNYPEIKSTVMFYSDLDKNWFSDWRPTESSDFIRWTFDLSDINNWFKGYGAFFQTKNQIEYDDEVTGVISPEMLKSENGNHYLLVDGMPFYMKGICYNPGHDWEEGFYPLSRKQLEKDFEQIKNMGSNTIRRYEPSIYDRNILKVADENGLKIMYGFWFDPKIDYRLDRKKLKEYEKKIIASVEKYKEDQNIIAWNIGNETWGLLKKYYAQPYLALVRIHYLQFLNNLALKIKKIDPTRPVFSSEEHDNERLYGVLHQYKAHAPHIDVIGVNSYYEENIGKIDSIFESFYPEIPYAVTEFGPKGYWNNQMGDYWNNYLLIELSSISKAEWYKKQWVEIIEKNKGKNLGGFAFSWRDRYEGTSTWFGITDYKGRLKPSYYYLESVWKKDEKVNLEFPDISIVGPWHYRKPGESVWLSATILNDYKGKLNFEWEVHEEKTWKKTTSVLTNLEDGKFVEIRLPSKDSRVYVFATDTLGNVITASRPLLINN